MLETTSTAPLCGSVPPSARGRRMCGRSSAPQDGKARPSEAGSSPVALATAAISMPDLVPSRKELNICGFMRSEEHTSELQSLMRTPYVVFYLKKKKPTLVTHTEYDNYNHLAFETHHNVHYINICLTRLHRHH